MFSHFYQCDFFALARFSEINQMRAAVGFRMELDERLRILQDGVVIAM